MNPQQIISDSMQFDSLSMKDVEDFHRPNENMLFKAGVFDCLPTYKFCLKIDVTLFSLIVQVAIVGPSNV